MRRSTILSIFSILLLPLLEASVVSPTSTERALVLKQAAFPRYVGAALGQGHLQNATDPNFRTIAAIEYSGATPENEMKWEIIEPFQNQFNFTPGDVIRDFAQAHDFTLRGHTLVWHNQLAPFVSTLNGTDLLHAMTNHITKVMTHFRGQIFAWDVVNEALNDDGTLGPSPFLTQIGPSYIETAFRTARAADPHAKLYINDFNTEGINNKSDALLTIVKNLKKENLIDGVGFQSHFIVGEVPTDLQANLQRFIDAGVQVAITELDVRTTLPVTQAVAEQHPKDFAFVVNACKSVSDCVGVTTWGITDLYSWIPGTFPGQGFGLLWDDNYVKKPAYSSVLATLEAH